MSVRVVAVVSDSSAHAIEDAIRFRVAVLINTIAAFLAYRTVDIEFNVALPLMATLLGSVFSHWRRAEANLLVKWCLAFGMLYVLWDSLELLTRGAIDPRLSLAQLLLNLQMLNSFDLPRRRNLRVALLVTTILMVVTATLSRTTGYGALLAIFCVSLLWALYEGYRAEVDLPAANFATPVRVVAGFLVGTLLLGLPLFIVAPRNQRTLASHSLPMSFNIALPTNLDRRVHAADMHAAGGGTKSAQRNYSGFSEHLDLNTRTALSEDVVLRVKSDRPTYWRALAFDHYDGRGWSMSRPEEVEVLTSPTPPFRVRWSRDEVFGSGEELVQTFYVEQDQANLIYAAWTPQHVYFPTGMIWRDPYGGIRSPITLQKDMYYTVVSRIPPIPTRALATLPQAPVPRQLRPFLELPPVSERTRALARRIVGKTKNPSAKLTAMRDYLAMHYVYDLDAPQAPDGAEWVDFFLFSQRRGFCEQFATSLAVLGRLEGIPTRLVTGFVPGDYNPFTDFYEVKGKHAHAWVEAWLPVVGWVPFDPTPGSLMTSNEATGLPSEPVGAALIAYFKPWLSARPWALAVLGCLCVAAIAWLARVAGVRRDRPRPVTAVYRRLRRRLARRGLVAAEVQTPRAWLAAAADVPDVAPALGALETFVARYEASRFGAQAGDERALAAELAVLARQVEADLVRAPRGAVKSPLSG